MDNQSNQEIQFQTLADLPIGTSAKVVSVAENGAVSRRLMEMGIIPGISVRVVKTAPFGCPLEIRVRGYNLAIRRSEAENIEIIK
jgi:Fe2+ transport system protein FeoA